jgi:hypothetical protein
VKSFNLSGAINALKSSQAVSHVNVELQTSVSEISSFPIISDTSRLDNIQRDKGGEEYAKQISETNRQIGTPD